MAKRMTADNFAKGIPHLESVRPTREKLDDLYTDVNERFRNYSRWIASVEEQQRNLRVDAIVQFRDRGFWGRLSWLLRGK